MIEERRFHGLAHYFQANWPRFLRLYALAMILLVGIGLLAERGWWAFVPMVTAVLLLIITSLIMQGWDAYQRFDAAGIQPHHFLFELARIQPTDTFVYIDLGERQRAIDLSKRMTNGRIIVLDVYNPQWTRNKALIRWRDRLSHPPPDPRLSWRDGGFKLLPLPDSCVQSVMLCEILGEFWQAGDRLSLLKEAHRILEPQGYILLAEPCRTQINALVHGLGLLDLEPSAYWVDLLHRAGFELRNIQTPWGLLTCMRAQKPAPIRGEQLSMPF